MGIEHVHPLISTTQFFTLILGQNFFGFFVGGPVNNLSEPRFEQSWGGPKPFFGVEFWLFSQPLQPRFFPLFIQTNFFRDDPSLEFLPFRPRISRPGIFGISQT